MTFVSTGGRAPRTGLKEALFRGLAPDGGLYFPAELPRFRPDQVASMVGEGWPGMASSLAASLLSDEMHPQEIDTLISKALDFPIPLLRLTDRIFILELFHGPTLAFKDVGARCMAQMMSHFRKTETEPLTILTATSGDTGGAVAHAFLGLPAIRAIVLFPDGQVTPRQEYQFSTLGENVLAIAVQGDFDDCQRMAKEVFRDQALRESVSLTSANSINIGRLLPQSFYFFHAWGLLRKTVDTTDWPEVLFTVPSGNFGNMAAGLMAKAMGLPEASFLAATNANDGVPRYLESGHFRPKPSCRTISTAMDVGSPSNLDRILHLYGGDLENLRRDLSGRSVTDEDTKATIKRVHGDAGYVLDPHTAVGFTALERELENRPKATGILLATAHPSKFAEVVEPVVGESLHLPPELSLCLERERKVTRLPSDTEALKSFLREG